MLKLSEVRLNMEYLTKGIESAIEVCTLSSYPKIFVKKDSMATKMNAIYNKIGFNKIFQCDEELTLVNMLVFMINNGYPLSEEELEIFNSYDEVVRSSANRKPIVAPPRIEYDGINMTENYSKKIPQIAKYLVKRFKPLGHLERFYNKEISGEQLTEHLTNFINSQVTIVQYDTNILMRIPRNYYSNKNKIRVYLPTTVDMSNTTENDILLSLMINELNKPSYGAFDSQTCNQIIQTLKAHGNLYEFSDNIESLSLVFNLEMLRRYYLCDSIKELLEPYFTLGTPTELQTNHGSYVVIGNYDETLSICGKVIFKVDKENYRRTCAILTKYPMTSSKKATVTIDEDKKTIWDLLLPNSKALDGDYNNILRGNVNEQE